MPPYSNIFDIMWDKELYVQNWSTLRQIVLSLDGTVRGFLKKKYIYVQEGSVLFVKFFHITHVIHGVNSLSGLGICQWFVRGKSYWNNLMPHNVETGKSFWMQDAIFARPLNKS